jgi:hypothetical protein
MDYDLTKEQQYIQKAAREFAVGEFPAVALEYDINETFPSSPKNTADPDLVFSSRPWCWKSSGKSIRVSPRSFAPYHSALKN